VPAFWVKLGANDLNCVDAPLNPTHSLTTHSCVTPKTAKQTNKSSTGSKVVQMVLPVLLHCSYAIMVRVYCTIICSVLEYACPVWQPGLTTDSSKDTERVQKCCPKLLYPSFSYTEALCKSGLYRLDYRRDLITHTKNIFREIKDPQHPLHYCPVLVSGPMSVIIVE